MSDAVDVLNEVIAGKDAEIERLRGDLANLYRLRRECVEMADDLADVIALLVGTYRMDEPEVRRVLARYREARRR
jgi:hypothetical protein